MAQPPYRRIAEELRARIDRGELRPGDQVPSARAITRQWGVALATATRVLATLSAEGVTKSLPGRGTVVAGPAVAGARSAAPGTGHAQEAAAGADPGRESPGGPARAARRGGGEGELTRDRIVAAAVRVADAEGLAQLSMRRIATDLGAAPMSLYRHVKDKDDLLVSMLDTAVGEDPLPERPPAGWRAQLELSSRTQWRGFRRHPWLAQALSVTRPQLIPNGMRHTEWALRALDGLGLSLQEMMYVHVTLFSHVRGLALNIEAEAQAEQDSGLTSEEWLQAQEGGFLAIAQGGEFPFIAAVVASDLDLDLDELFEYGLSRLLDGLARHLEGRPGGTAS